MKLIDTHSHIYEPEFDADRDEAVARARAAGVERLLFPAIDASTHGRMLDACRRYGDCCLPMMGLHPTSLNDNPRWREELDEAAALLKNPPAGIRFVGVGEIGLDLYWSAAFRDEQIEAFRRQCRLALECDLPIAVHTRNAWAEMERVVGEFRGSGLRGVFHVGTRDTSDYTGFLDRLSTLLGLPRPAYMVERNRVPAYQAVLPGRGELPEHLHLSVEGVLRSLSQLEKSGPAIN